MATSSTSCGAAVNRITSPSSSLMPTTLLHGVLAPNAKLAPPDSGDLQHAHVDLSSCWMTEHVSGGGEPGRAYLADPLSSARSSTRTGGEKLIFIRPFHEQGRYRPSRRTLKSGPL
jgi:hypothetical protein